MTSPTHFFNYDELTWDEVANLPHDTPLALPLDSGYDHAELPNQLSNPERCRLLPPFPFGWRNSGLEIPDQIFWQYIINLLDSLRDDGFTKVVWLAPSGIDPQSSFIVNFPILRQHHVSMNQQSCEITSKCDGKHVPIKK